MLKYVFDKIEERDVDFIIMRAFAELPEFRRLFLQRIGYEFCEVVSIEHSFMDNELGESDITIIIKSENKQIGLLVENKINARAMQEQCARYTRRGKKGKEDGLYDEFAVFLVAPQSYMNHNDEAKKYPNRISYEEIRGIFEDAEKVYDAEIIEGAIKKQAQGYMVQEVPAITEFWRKLYNYSCISKRALEMYEVEGPKGARATWPQFKIPLKGAELYYKARYGFCDLQFSGKLYDSIRLKKELRNFIDGDMHWAETGTSLSLRIKKMPMNFNKPFESYIEEVEDMLCAIERLTLLAIKFNDIGFVI